MSEKAAKSPEKAASETRKWINELQPDVVVTERSGRRSKKDGKTLEVNAAMARTAEHNYLLGVARFRWPDAPECAAPPLQPVERVLEQPFSCTIICMKKIDLKLVAGEFKNPLLEKILFPEQVHEIFKSLKDKASETLLVVYLKDDFRGLYDVHSTGASSWTGFDQHDLFGRAYMTKSRYMILVHNHPNGNSKPSGGDLEILETIKELSAPLDKRRILGLLDFIIVAEDGYWSWAEEENNVQGYEETV